MIDAIFRGSARGGGMVKMTRELQALSRTVAAFWTRTALAIAAENFRVPILAMT